LRRHSAYTVIPGISYIEVAQAVSRNAGGNLNRGVKSGAAITAETVSMVARDRGDEIAADRLRLEDSAAGQYEARANQGFRTLMGPMAQEKLCKRHSTPSRTSEKGTHFANLIIIPIVPFQTSSSPSSPSMMLAIGRQKTLAYADSLDGATNRYRGLETGRRVTIEPNGQGVVVKPEAAAAQQEGTGQPPLRQRQP